MKHEITYACSLLLVLAGCAAAPPGAPVPSEKPQSPIAAQSPAVEPSGPAVDAPPAPAPAPVASAPAEPNAAPAAPAPPAAPQSAVAPTPIAKPAPQASTSKPKPAAVPRQATPTPAPATSAAAKPAAAAPSLDLAALEQRLRDTHAIGLFTKLSIKNQVDDLLDAFREHFKGQTPPLTTLRQRFDLLLMKVLSSVQDGDPPLASDIASSRETIWKLLNDPAKLTSI